MASLPVAGTTPAESKFRRVNKISISEEIAQQILDLISSGHLAPGQRLPSERELCKTFGAARSSLREALRCLSIIGVLNARVGEGTSVASDGGKFLGKIMEWRLITERHDIENLLEVRIALEGTAAADMALRGTEADIAKLRDLLSQLKASIKDNHDFAALDLEFHITIAKASGNSLLFDLVSMIRGQLAGGLSKVLLLPNAMPLSFKEHTAIFKAIEQRDPDASRKAMHAHLDAALSRYRAALAKRIASAVQTSSPAKGRSPNLLR
jgi:GntR family transcriptional regulator, transcriptional repressor for pyruvate dehydrogenase complex